MQIDWNLRILYFNSVCAILSLVFLYMSGFNSSEKKVSLFRIFRHFDILTSEEGIKVHLIKYATMWSNWTIDFIVKLVRETAERSKLEKKTYFK